MAMFENFPYTDMHNLNLDWIIKIAKDFLDQYTHIQQLIEDGEASLQNLTEEGLQQLQDKADNLESLLNEWYNTHSDDIAQQLASAISDLNSWYTTHENYLDATLASNILAFQTAADQKAAQTLASIPDDYTALNNAVRATVAQIEKPFIVHGALVNVSTTYPAVSGYIDTEGNLQTGVVSGTWSTDFIDINDSLNKLMTVLVHPALYGNPNVAVYDGEETYIGALTLSGFYDDIMETYNISRIVILNQYANAAYIRVSSWTNQKPVIFLADLIDATNGYNALAAYTDKTFKEIDKPFTWNYLNPSLTAGYLDRYNGNFVSYTAEYCRTTSFIDITQYKLLDITAQIKYGQAVIALYDENQVLIQILINENISGYILDYDLINALYMGVKYVRVSSFNIDPVIKYSQYETERIWKRIIINNEVNIKNGYIDHSTGNFEPYSDSKTTDFIDINEYDAVYYYGKAHENNANMWALYNSSRQMIASQQANFDNNFIQNYKIDIAALRIEYSSAAYIRICAIYSPLYLSAFRWVHGADMIKQLSDQNVLFGKKYVACGDSFTEGPFTGAYANRDLYYDYNYQCWKTYPYWIATRNNMDLLNEAIGGTTMYFDGTHTNAFSVQRYKDVPSDADYITLEFGLNETGAPIGTLNDTDNTTVMGAWNVVLAYLIENHPYAKIGIIISDSWLGTNIYNAMVQVAEYWGIPYLDMRKGIQVPMGINGRLGETISAQAKSLRDAAFMISENDGHPNPMAHEYRSTFIENWLRTL